jgi:hypothetical protein
MNRTRVSPLLAATACAGLALAACTADTHLTAPDTQTSASAQAPALHAKGVTRGHLDIPVELDMWVGLDVIPCVDEPVRFVVSAVLTLDWLVTPSGVTNTRGYFVVDRSVSYLVYKGVNYYLAPGRVGHDGIIHIVEGSSGLYVEAGVEPNFSVSETGERLRLNLQWQIVFDANGTERVFKATGGCLRGG